MLENLESLMGDLMIVCEGAFMSLDNGEKYFSIKNNLYKMHEKRGEYVFCRDDSSLSLEKIYRLIKNVYKNVDWKKYKSAVKDAMLDWKEFYSGVKKKIEYL